MSTQCYSLVYAVPIITGVSVCSDGKRSIHVSGILQGMGVIKRYSNLKPSLKLMIGSVECYATVSISDHQYSLNYVYTIIYN